MHESSVVRLLEQVGAILRNDHFIYTSGRHGSDYINKDALYPHTAATRRLTRALAEHAVEYDIDIVAGPALGGIILSQWTAYHLSHLKQREVLGIYSEKDAQGVQVFRRGYDQLLQGKRVLLVEDVLTTGHSVLALAQRVRENDASVAAVGALVNRAPQTITADYLGAPFYALANLEFPSWRAEDCPLCAAGIPINTRVGKGAQLAR